MRASSAVGGGRGGDLRGRCCPVLHHGVLCPVIATPRPDPPRRLGHRVARWLAAGSTDGERGDAALLRRRRRTTVLCPARGWLRRQFGWARWRRVLGGDVGSPAAVHPRAEALVRAESSRGKGGQALGSSGLAVARRPSTAQGAHDHKQTQPETLRPHAGSRHPPSHPSPRLSPISGDWSARPCASGNVGQPPRFINRHRSEKKPTHSSGSLFSEPYKTDLQKSSLLEAARGPNSQFQRRTIAPQFSLNFPALLYLKGTKKEGVPYVSSSHEWSRD